MILFSSSPLSDQVAQWRWRRDYEVVSFNTDLRHLKTADFALLLWRRYCCIGNKCWPAGTC